MEKYNIGSTESVNLQRYSMQKVMLFYNDRWLTFLSRFKIPLLNVLTFKEFLNVLHLWNSQLHFAQGHILICKLLIKCIFLQSRRNYWVIKHQHWKAKITQTHQAGRLLLWKQIKANVYRDLIEPFYMRRRQMHFINSDKWPSHLFFSKLVRELQSVRDVATFASNFCLSFCCWIIRSEECTRQIDRKTDDSQQGTVTKGRPQRNASIDIV